MTGSPQQALWQAVLLEAVNDAVLGVPQVITDSSRREHANAKARAYVLDAGRDFRHVCDLAGFDPEIVREAVRKRIEKPITIKQRERVDSALYTFAGTTDTLTGWATRLGIKRAILRERLKTGWTVEEMLTLPAGSRRPKPKADPKPTPTRQPTTASTFNAYRASRKGVGGRPSRTLTHQGQTRTLDEWARIAGISKSTLFSRLRNGWDMDRVLNQPLQTHRTTGDRGGADASRKGPGVGPVFEGCSGTGAVGSARATPKMCSEPPLNLDFSET